MVAAWILFGLPIDEMTQFPPKRGFKFHPNVIVQVALTSEMGYDGESGLPKSLPLTDPRNSDWLHRLSSWSAAADRVYIWQYTYHGRYTFTPLPNYFLVAEDLATLSSLGVKGWFAESVCCHPREEMVELKVYLWGRLAFDPTLNATELTLGFLDGYYSAAAAPHVMRYLQLMDSSLRLRGGSRPGMPRSWPHNNATKRNEDLWAWGPYSAMFDNNTVLESRAALGGAAAAVASDPKLSFRVAQALTAVQFVALYRWQELRAYAALSKTPWPFAATIAGEFDLFAVALNRSGNGGTAVTSTNAALAPNGSRNAGGAVTVGELREQVLAHALAL